MLQGGAANPETINHWFKLNQTIIEYSIVPELIFVMDEMNCFINKSTRCFKVIGCANQHSQMSLMNENQETITLIPGCLYPPTVIFKGKQIRKKKELPNPLGAL